MDGGAGAALSPHEEPIVLQPARTSPRRLIVPLLLCAGMLLIPLVALGSAGGTVGSNQVTSKKGRLGGHRAASGGVGALAADPTTTLGEGPSTTDSSPVDVMAAAATDPTRVTAPTAASRPTVTAAAASRPVVAASTESSTGASHPATTSPPTTRPAPTTTAAPQPSHSESGQASYYDQAPNGTCAHPTLPFGTVVSIVDTDNGRTATCTVEDRGPYASGRIIDLAQNVFTQMAPTSAGVINVRISW